MKLIGLLGGMSWESTAVYYRILNEEVRTRLGGQHSARVLLYSVDFAEIERLQHEERWNEAGRRLAAAALALERGGAQLLVLCTNTMHRLAPELERVLSIPLLHIADAAGEEARRRGLDTVALLGTRFTVEQPFYRQRLETQHDLRVLVPDDRARGIVHDVIYDELCRGRIVDASRRALMQIISDLEADGAQGVVLGCTELPLLITEDASSLPILDTTRLHALAALDHALAGATPS